MSLSSLAVDGGPDAPSEARRLVAEHLTGQVAERVLEDCGLLVSELVTNSVIHGHVGHAGRVELAIDVSGERVRIEVTDPGPGFAGEPAGAGAEEPGGFGLFLVTQVADAWGVSGDEDPTTVWFELRRG